MRTMGVEFSYWPFLLRNNKIGTGKKRSANAKHADVYSSQRRIATQNCYAIRRPENSQPGQKWKRPSVYPVCGASQAPEEPESPTFHSAAKMAIAARLAKIMRITATMRPTRQASGRRKHWPHFDGKPSPSGEA